MPSKQVLIIEDEAGVARVIKAVLASDGYEVLHAASAEEALTLWEQNAKSIPVVLTDLSLSEKLTGDVSAAG